MEVTVIENHYDPDQADTSSEATFIFLVRESGKLRVEQGKHTLGLFSLKTWERILQKTGFRVHKRVQRLAVGDLDIFVCKK
jgi:hypothetical protein